MDAAHDPSEPASVRPSLFVLAPIVFALAMPAPASAGQEPLACAHQFLTSGLVDGCTYIGNEYNTVLMPNPYVPHCVPGPPCPPPTAVAEHGAFMYTFGAWAGV